MHCCEEVGPELRVYVDVRPIRDRPVVVAPELREMVVEECIADAIGRSMILFIFPFFMAAVSGADVDMIQRLDTEAALSLIRVSSRQEEKLCICQNRTGDEPRRLASSRSLQSLT